MILVVFWDSNSSTNFILNTFWNLLLFFWQPLGHWESILKHMVKIWDWFLNHLVAIWDILKQSGSHLSFLLFCKNVKLNNLQPTCISKQPQSALPAHRAFGVLKDMLEFQLEGLGSRPFVHRYLQYEFELLAFCCNGERFLKSIHFPWRSPSTCGKCGCSEALLLNFCLTFYGNAFAFVDLANNLYWFWLVVWG